MLIRQAHSNLAMSHVITFPLEARWAGHRSSISLASPTYIRAVAVSVFTTGAPATLGNQLAALRLDYLVIFGLGEMGTPRQAQFYTRRLFSWDSNS